MLTKAEIGTREYAVAVVDIIGYGKAVEGLQNFELEKPLNIQSLMSYYGNLEDNAKSSADDGGQACEVLERNLTVP